MGIFATQQPVVFGQSHNRNINAASSTFSVSTNTATWTAPGITEVSITPEVTTTQGGLQNSQACLVTFDAPNDATATAWMADGGTSSTDIAYAIVFAGQTRTFNFSSPITRIDVLPIGTGNTVMRVIVEAN